MSPLRILATASVALAILSGCAEPPPRPEASPEAAVAQERVEPAVAPAITVMRTQKGRVSLYGREFAGRKTASGEPFDPEALTMAHRTLPFGTRVRVTNIENGRSVEVVVNDRGPFVAGRIADVSLAAARRLGMVTDGVVDALIEILARAN